MDKKFSKVEKDLERLGRHQNRMLVALKDVSEKMKNSRGLNGGFKGDLNVLVKKAPDEDML